MHAICCVHKNLSISIITIRFHIEVIVCVFIVFCQHLSGDGNEERGGRQEPCKEEEAEGYKREQPCKEQVLVMEVCVR
jgi:hypothetical protein